MEYTMIERDEDFYPLIDRLGTKSAIAIDFEEECNLHIYGEHICLIQIYDQESFYLVDVRSKDISKQALAAFFALPIEKLWFDCRSDLAMLYRIYGITVSNVTDLRVYTMALGFQFSLDRVKEEYLGIRKDGSKKRHQTENWLRRPLSEESIEYALEDVEQLFDLRKVLYRKIQEEGLVKKTREEMKHVLRLSPSKPGWMKICNTRLLSEEERCYLKHIFNARERLAKRFNVPAVNVLEKKEIVRLAKKIPASMDVLFVELSSAPQRFRNLLVPEVWMAIESAREELAQKTVKKK